MKRAYLIPIVAVEILAAYYFVGKLYPRATAKRRYLPEVHNIARLREVDRIKALPQCALPKPGKGVAPVIAAGPNFNFTINVSPDWRRTGFDTTSAMFQDPNATFTNKRGHRITITRVIDGSVSRAYLADTLANPLPANECEVSNEKAGSIWTLYPGKTAVRGRGRQKYIGLADAITAGGKRFKFDVAAWSVAERDSLASIVAQAVLYQ